MCLYGARAFGVSFYPQTKHFILPPHSSSTPLSFTCFFFIVFVATVVVTIVVTVLILFGLPYVTHRSMQTIFHQHSIWNMFDKNWTLPRFVVLFSPMIFNIHFNRSQIHSIPNCTKCIHWHHLSWLFIHFQNQLFSLLSCKFISLKRMLLSQQNG